MEYIYAAMLIHKAGKKIDEASVKRVLEAAGVAVNESKIKALIASLEGVDIEKAIKEAALPVAAPAQTPAQGAKAEEKVAPEEKKKTEEQAAAGLGALFG